MLCAPLTAAIKEISKKEKGVWLKILLQLRIGATQVKVCVKYGEARKWPWPTWIGVWIDELRVSYKYNVMWCRF